MIKNILRGLVIEVLLTITLFIFFIVVMNTGLPVNINEKQQIVKELWDLNKYLTILIISALTPPVCLMVWGILYYPYTGFLLLLNFATTGELNPKRQREL